MEKGGSTMSEKYYNPVLDAGELENKQLWLAGAIAMVRADMAAEERKKAKAEAGEEDPQLPQNREAESL